MNVPPNQEAADEQLGESWLATASQNILPLSRSQDFRTALAEWSYLPPPIDRERAEERCELCGHENLRWHYPIWNRLTDSRLMVGSVCILRFTEISVLDADGNQLTSRSERKAKLDSDWSKLRETTLLDSLRQLYRKLNDCSEKLQLAAIVERFKAKGGFSTIELLWLFRCLKRHQLKYDSSLFKVRLRSKLDQKKLNSLTNSEFSMIRDCLSSA